MSISSRDCLLENAISAVCYPFCSHSRRLEIVHIWFEWPTPTRALRGNFVDRTFLLFFFAVKLGTSEMLGMSFWTKKKCITFLNLYVPPDCLCARARVFFNAKSLDFYTVGTSIEICSLGLCKSIHHALVNVFFFLHFFFIVSRATTACTESALNAANRREKRENKEKK